MRNVAFAVALMACAPSQALAADLLEVFLATKDASDRSTNVGVARASFPPASPLGLSLDPATEAWLGSIPRRGGAPFLVQALATRRARTIVNTDVDDTLIPNLWDRGRYPRGEPYPGVAELLAAQGDSLVVLTARPSFRGLLSSRTREAVLRVLGAAGAEVDVSVSSGEALDVLDTLDMGLRKAESLLEQRKQLPESRSVFNGDSGQGDWIAALIVRDLDPEGFPYATIHDVRPWSRAHASAMQAAMAASARLDALYPDAERAAAFRKQVARAMDGPNGRLDGRVLLERRVFLFRNHVDLALDLAAAGLIEPEAADRVVAAAWKGTRYLRQAPFGYDRGASERTARRLREWAAARSPTLQAAQRP